MDKSGRPRFNQNTGERIIYEDEIASVQVEPAPVQQKKSGCLKGCLITLVIFIVVLALLVIGGYTIYKRNKPEDVQFDATKVESFYEKAGIDNENYTVSVEEILTGQAIPSGEVTVEQSFTSAEITSVIQDASNKGDYLKDVSIKFSGQDQAEISLKVSDKIEDIYDIVPTLENYAFIIDKLTGQPIYYLGEIVYDEETGFELNAEKIKVGIFKIPASTLSTIDSTIASLFNDTLENMQGFEIEAMEINEDSLDFLGTIPEIIE